MPETMFETERLLVRRLTRADLASLHAVYGDAGAMRWVGDGKAITEADCLKWLEVTERNYRNRGYGMSALVARSSGEVVGFCGLVHPGGQDEVEIKYALGRRWWGAGLATEAVQAMLRHGAWAHGMSRIIATVAPANAASQRVLEKVGMIHAGIRKNDDGSATNVFEWRSSEAGTAF